MQSRIVAWAVAAVIGIGAATAATLARAEGEPFVMTFKDNKLEPAELQVPAGTEFKLVVKNADQTPEEFESEDLKVEKVIAGGSEAEFTIKALDPGSYEVYGEFHEDTAKGHIVAK
ncbi:MAG TPA: cupredoxin domain-containing protein [Candidatus Acidoferrum sp.]|nr:cupredoxin domain-containing protein [Candidatus Acidoferrum sp.]